MIIAPSARAWSILVEMRESGSLTMSQMPLALCVLRLEKPKDSGTYAGGSMCNPDAPQAQATWSATLRT